MNWVTTLRVGVGRGTTWRRLATQRTLATAITRLWRAGGEKNWCWLRRDCFWKPPARTLFACALSLVYASCTPSRMRARSLWGGIKGLVTNSVLLVLSRACTLSLIRPLVRIVAELCARASDCRSLNTTFARPISPSRCSPGLLQCGACHQLRDRRCMGEHGEQEKDQDEE